MKEQDLGVKWFNTLFYPEHRVARAVRYHDPDGTLTRLRAPKITLFTPWGPCYNQHRPLAERGYTRERRTLEYLASLLTQWQSKLHEREWKWIILAADRYGTTLNSLPESWVEEYFGEVQALTRSIFPAASFERWSTHAEVANEERERATWELNQRVSWSIQERARKTAGRRSFGDPNAYLVERLTEAFYHERTEHPIKISLAPPHKDSQVDADLPRLYLVPEELRTPWLF